MMNRKRWYAWLLLMGMMLALLVSSAYTVREADHICLHEDCEICDHIARCEALLQSFALAALIALILMPAQSASVSLRCWGGFRLPVCGTLVSWKIRLND